MDVLLDTDLLRSKRRSTVEFLKQWRPRPQLSTALQVLGQPPLGLGEVPKRRSARKGCIMSRNHHLKHFMGTFSPLRCDLEKNLRSTLKRVGLTLDARCK